METLTGLLKKGQEILVQAGIEEAGLDARLLLEYITGKSRAYYLAHGEECVTKETEDIVSGVGHRSLAAYPSSASDASGFFYGI